MTDGQHTDHVENSLPNMALPAWTIDDLPAPRPLSLRSLASFIGPGIVMCGIQIGGGEWLLGPEVTAKYGGSLMWVATVAIVCQVFYNMECGRYALYTGEPVFTGFMRNQPGPSFWIGVFALFNVSALIPALTTTAAAVVVALFIGGVPGPEYENLLIGLSYLLFGLVALPVLVGGKIYNTLEKVMTAKVVVVLGFCLFTGVFFVGPRNWARVFSGFLEFGNVPVERGEDRNGNGQLDAGEDWDGDGHLDRVEPRFNMGDLFPKDVKFQTVDTDGDGVYDSIERLPSVAENSSSEGDARGVPVTQLSLSVHGKLQTCTVERGEIEMDLGDGPQRYPLYLTSGRSAKHPCYIDVDDDGHWDGDNIDNVIRSLWTGAGWPAITLANIAVLGAFAGYAGGGGLSNSTYSSFVRDKGWGMGSRVGAIPSVVGGRGITLSHLGKVFAINAENLRRWKGWWRYILTDQLLVWGPGCFMGMALPGLISIEFSQYSGFYTDTEGLDWAQALITADGLKNSPAIGSWGNLFWIATVFVGLMVLLPSQMSIIDDVCRRWTDIIWSGVGTVRNRMHSNEVSKIYYGIMIVYIVWSLVMQTVFLKYSNARGMVLTVANTNNLALGLTAIMVLVNNLRFLPPAIRPRWWHTCGMIACAVFYLGMTVLVCWMTPASLWFFALFGVWMVVWLVFAGLRRTKPSL